MAGSVYWIGQNGNTYLKSPNTDVSGTWNTTDLGQMASGFVPTGATLISDPTLKQAAPTNTTVAGPALNTAAVNNTQTAIDQIGPLLQAALDAEATNHQNTVNTFDQQEAGQRKTYDGSTVTNQQNYDANFMDSLRAGIHGLGGLLGILRGTGAAGGTADKQVRDVVGGQTAQDIRAGADTQKENQGQLDSSLQTFLTDLKGKRQQNEDTFVNNDRAIHRDSNTQLQDLYSKMAGYYGDAGNTGKATDWMNLAGNLTPQIAADSRTQVSPYDTSPVIVHAPNLTAFSGPTQPDVGANAAPSDGQVGAGIFTMGDRRRDKQATPTPALAGV